MLKLKHQMKTNTKTTTYILLAILVCVLVGIIYFKFRLNKDIEYIIETKRNNFFASEEIRSIVGLKSKLEAAKKVSDAFDDLYIDRNNILSFIETIEKVAASHNVVLSIDTMTIDESHLAEVPAYGILNMSLTVSGNFQSITDFISALEKLPYFINITTVRLNRPESEGDNSWIANMSLFGLTN